MNNKGKSSSLLFLLILVVILLCVTFITVFLLKQETERRKAIERSLSQLKKSKQEIELQYEDTQKQMVLLQDELKQAELKIKTLITDADLSKAQQAAFQDENTSLKEKLEKEQAEKSDLAARMKQAQEELETIKGKMGKAEKVAKEKAPPSPMEQNEIVLDKIVVSPPKTEGSILTVNQQYQFVVTNLGQPDAIAPDQELIVSRDNQELGELRVQRVQGNLSVADPIPPLTAELLEEGDLVAIKK